MAVSNIDLARFKRLGVRSSDVWQGGIVRLPLWIEGKRDDPPYRARGAFWFSTRTGLVWVKTEDAPHTAGVDLGLHGLIDFAKKYERDLMGRPSRIEVTDAAFARDLAALLDDRDTTIAVVADLPNVRGALRAFETFQNEDEPMPAPLLDSPGVTIEVVRGFADAAARFYAANLWHAFTPDDDLIVVESPVVDPALQHFVITGSTRILRGLTFFASREHFERFVAHPPTGNRRKPLIWMLSFDPIDWLPFGDVDAWTDYDLPVAAPDAYPRPGLIQPYGGLARPDAGRLAFLEAVLRAMAESTDEDFDSGRWTRRVETTGGPVEVRLSLPGLLDAIAAETDPATAGGSGVPSRLGARMHMAQAQTLAYAAMEATGRYQIHLARRAIAISRDCTDAWSILGHRARDVSEALPFYREAVAAGERTLGAEYFEKEAGHFWGLVETRPYMRARYALADALDADGQADEAIAHYRELIRLNPGDHQGARRLLLLLLIKGHRDADARALVDQFKEDESAEWMYADALVAFRLQAEDAVERLRRALTANRHVPPFLSGEKEIPELPQSYRTGSVEEAAIAADWLVDVWTETPGAVFWLNTHRRLAKMTRAKGRRKPITDK